ncbi:hypothetical protein [Croceiramulus getboli]|nr:hypothetical protein P8624_03740 [Flavobacteriaceae bacterium YJPT1-3]
MKKTIERLLCGLLLVGGLFHSTAQVKIEQEFRMDPKEVPAKAITYLELMQAGHKVKWYKEQGADRSTIEGKFKKEGRKFSVEFDEQGQLEDVEVEIRWRQVPEALRKVIGTQLGQQFKRFRVKRVQEHYPQDAGRILDWHLKQQPFPPYFEIELKGVNDEGSKLYEFLFDPDGKEVRQSIILLRNTDNLEF